MKRLGNNKVSSNAEFGAGAGTSTTGTTRKAAGTSTTGTTPTVLTHDLEATFRYNNMPSLEIQEDDASLTLSHAAAPSRSWNWQAYCVTTFVIATQLPGALVLTVLGIQQQKYSPILVARYFWIWCIGVLFLLRHGAFEWDIRWRNAASLKLCKHAGRLLTAPYKNSRISRDSTDISLADVRFFRTILRADVDGFGTVNSTENFYGVEIVSLRAPIVLGIFDDEDCCIKAAERMDAFLSEWREGQHGITPPVSVISKESPHIPSTIDINHETKLVPEPFSECRFTFKHRPDNAFLCVRRGSLPRHLASFLLVFNLEWYLSVLLYLFNPKSSLRGIIANGWVIIGTVLLALLLLLALGFGWQGDRWIFSPDHCERQGLFTVRRMRRRILDFDQMELFAT